MLAGIPEHADDLSSGMTPPPENSNLRGTSAQSRSPVRFFVLTFVVSIPFLLLGASTGVQPLPGIPVSAFAFVCPGLAAAIRGYEEGKGAGGRELLKRVLDSSRTRAKVWWLS
jgi:hypothetical protein